MGLPPGTAAGGGEVCRSYYGRCLFQSGRKGPFVLPLCPGPAGSRVHRRGRGGSRGSGKDSAGPGDPAPCSPLPRPSAGGSEACEARAAGRCGEPGASTCAVNQGGARGGFAGVKPVGAGGAEPPSRPSAPAGQRRAARRRAGPGGPRGAGRDAGSGTGRGCAAPSPGWRCPLQAPGDSPARPCPHARVRSPGSCCHNLSSGAELRGPKRRRVSQADGDNRSLVRSFLWTLFMVGKGSIVSKCYQQK